MIDTIKFKVTINEAISQAIEKLGYTTQGTDNKTKTIKFKVWTTPVKIGSYSPDINIKHTDKVPDVCFVEFSVPKQYYGNNIQLLPFTDLEPALQTVQKALSERIPSFPPYKVWLVQRLDMCYAWRLPDQQTATEVLKNLRYYVKARDKQNKPYDKNETVMIVGKTYSQKFYLKQPEYLKHDFKRIKEVDTDRAYFLLQQSEGVLRYEITMRKRLLDYLFGDKLTVQKLLKQNLIGEHIKYFYKLLNNMDTKSQKSTEVFDTLNKKYSKQVALRLFQFYKIYYSDNPIDRQILLDNFDRRTKYRYLQRLREANIGLPNDKTEFNLTIPSDNEVNF